ncbi:MAG TPA: EamA family transporter [Candidatus Saccharimonadales bacterium]|nr:EamA family transporter [Candidatus Saccharimonadales bacterium]
MAKILIILIVAVVVESIGVAFLSGGLKEINSPSKISVGQIASLIKAGATNGKILLGVALEAAFFGALLYLLSQKDVSFVWPLTSLGFIVTTLMAHFILQEKVSPIRWSGVLLIACGASLIIYSEASKPAAPSAAIRSTTPLGQQ